MSSAPSQNKKQSAKNTKASNPKTYKSSFIYFYSPNNVTTEMSTQSYRQVGRAEGIINFHIDQTQSNSLLAVDRSNSPLGLPAKPINYSPYGHHAIDFGKLVGFNGQRQDPLTHNYYLKSRFFSPAIYRFCSSDQFSPFDKGGVNSYAYCEGDPINFTDPTGTVKSAISTLLNNHEKLMKYAKEIARDEKRLAQLNKKLNNPTSEAKLYLAGKAQNPGGAVQQAGYFKETAKPFVSASKKLEASIAQNLGKVKETFNQYVPNAEKYLLGSTPENAATFNTFDVKLEEVATRSMHEIFDKVFETRASLAR